jgi:hypothetical protein
MNHKRILILLSDTVIKILSLYKCKGNPVIGRGGLQEYEMLSIQHCLHNRLTDGGCQPYAPAALYLQKHFQIRISVKGLLNPKVMVRL